MFKKKKVLFICTGNACRSQIVHGLLNELSSSSFEVFSVGSHSSQVHLISIAVMEEIGINITKHTSDYLNMGINIVITVCDKANISYPTFPEDVKRIHWSFDDLFINWNFNLKELDTFRKTGEIKSRLLKFIQVNNIGK